MTLAKKAIKQRGPKSRKLTIAFDKPVPDILTERVHAPSHQERLTAALEAWPKRESTLIREFETEKQARFDAALEMFGIKKSELSDKSAGVYRIGSSELNENAARWILDGIFGKIFTGYIVGQQIEAKTKKWTLAHRNTAKIYSEALRKRAQGISATRAWIQACKNVLGGNQHDDSLATRWRDFKRDPVIRWVEELFCKIKRSERQKAEMVRIADVVDPDN